MNKRIERIKLLKSLAMNREKQAAEILSKANMQLKKEKNQLESLQQFKAEYVKKIDALVGEKMSCLSFNNQVNFVYYVDDILEQQSGVIQRIEVEVEKYRKIWSDAKRKSNSLDEILQKLEKEHRYEVEKREQKMNDESVLQKYAYAAIKKDNKTY